MEGTEAAPRPSPFAPRPARRFRAPRAPPHSPLGRRQQGHHLRQSGQRLEALGIDAASASEASEASVARMLAGRLRPFSPAFQVWRVREVVRLGDLGLPLSNSARLGGASVGSPSIDLPSCAGVMNQCIPVVPNGFGLGVVPVVQHGVPKMASTTPIHSSGYTRDVWSTVVLLPFKMQSPFPPTWKCTCKIISPGYAQGLFFGYPVASGRPCFKSPFGKGSVRTKPWESSGSIALWPANPLPIYGIYPGFVAFCVQLNPCRSRH